MRLIVIALLLGGVLAGCSSSSEENYNRSNHTWTTDHGTFGKDPISKNKVEVSRAVRRSYLGEVYYFENEANARAFDAHPSRYIYDENAIERSEEPTVR